MLRWRGRLMSAGGGLKRNSAVLVIVHRSRNTVSGSTAAWKRPWLTPRRAWLDLADNPVLIPRRDFKPSVASTALFPALELRSKQTDLRPPGRDDARQGSNPRSISALGELKAKPMFSLVVAAGIATAVCVSGIVGLLLQKVLPESHTSERSRDIIGGVVGLLTLLLALVLGLLIWTGYGVTTTQKAELQLLSARALEFDFE